MNNFLSFIILCFAGLFSFGSIGQCSPEELLNASLCEEGAISNENESSYALIIDGNQTLGMGLHQSGISLVNIAFSFSSPSSQYILNGGQVPPTLAVLLLKASRYFFYNGRGIFRGLAVKDIIFPFHYFW